MASRPGSGSDQAPDEGQDQGFFQCSRCKKSYNRADHLIRHVRSHTQEKPYVCEICGKGFARPDLVKRHAAGHDEDKSSGDGSGQRRRKRRTTVVEATEPDRVARACKACNQSKVKCSENWPCKRCTTKDLQCEPLDLDPGFGALLGDKTTRESHSRDEVPGASIEAPQALLSRSSPAFLRTQSDLDPIHHQIPRATQETASGVLEVDGAYYPGFLRHVVPELVSPSVSEEMEPQSFFPHHNRRLRPDDEGLGSSADLWYVDGLEHAFHINQESNFIPYTAVMSSGAAIATWAGMGADAFKRSTIGSWTPVPEDSSMLERQNITVPKNVDQAIFAQKKKLLVEPLTLNTRDRILGIVLEAGPQNALSRIIEGFPSAVFLTDCIEFYFSRRHEDQIDSYIHLPTLNPNKERAELLAMLAGAGAVCTPSVVIQKLGYALQEAVGYALKRRSDENSTVSRELCMLQTAWLQNEVGLWSDSRRKIEIAESFTQLNATILRRAGRFKRFPYSPVDVNEFDIGEVLEKKWQTWCKQESMKRVQYHAFLHDSRISIALHVSPVIGYPEVELPFPGPKELWAAPTAVKWKNEVLARDFNSAPRIVSLREALQDMSSITPCRSHIDIHYSALVLLHGLWSLVWEYKQLNSIGGQQSKYWNEVVLSARHQELCGALQQYRLDSRSWDTLCPRVTVVLELISLHLHMPVEELQLYAGKENVEEAEAAHRSARQWFSSPASRRAVWHAGQVLRAASWFLPETLFDFFIIAVYHASVAFWSFGIVGRSEGMPISPLVAGAHPQHGPCIVIDQEENSDLTTAFVDHAIGVPGLSGRDGSFIPLYNTAAVMEHVADRLLSNWKVGSQPPLMKSIRQLVLDLGAAAKN